MANINSTSTQVLDSEATSVTSLTSQVIVTDVSSTSVQNVEKYLLLAPPSISGVYSVSAQVLDSEVSSTTLTSVTSQVILIDSPASSAQEVSKQLLIQPVVTLTTQSVKMEVIGQSTIIPPVPGQETVWFFN